MRPLPIKADFDRAVKQRWSPETCLVAQLMIRRRFHPDLDAPYVFACRNKLRTLMNTFDRYFHVPGDEKKLALRRLRRALPTTNPVGAKLI